jgi:hypothetical protein
VTTVTLRTISASILATAALTCPVVADRAHAEVPSVDAYGGQALVLGAPHHRHPGGGSPSGSGNRSSGGGRSSGGSSSGSSGGGASGSRGQGASGSSQKASGPNGASGNRASRESGSTRTGGASGGRGGTASEAQGGSEQSVLGGKPAASTSGFGVSDVLLLIAGLICLAALALLLRAARRRTGPGSPAGSGQPPRPPDRSATG